MVSVQFRLVHVLCNIVLVTHCAAVLDSIGCVEISRDNYKELYTTIDQEIFVINKFSSAVLSDKNEIIFNINNKNVW